MMTVKIYRPAHSPAQSSHDLPKAWLLEFDTISAQSKNMFSQIHLTFSTCERAITYAKKHGWDYIVYPENLRSIKPRNLGYSRFD